METFVYWDTVQEIQPVRQAPKSKIIHSAMLKDNIVLVSEENVTVHPHKNTNTKVRSLEFRFSVMTVANNASLAYFLTDQGHLWAYGCDDLKAGLLAEESLLTTEVPILLSFTTQNPLSKVALAKSHAGGITLEGALITWGSGKNGELGDLTVSKSRPQMVQQASFFKSVEICCGDKYTAVCTEAGFLFIFSKRKNCSNCKKTSSYPCTVHNLQNDFVTKVFAYNEDLVIINDLGEVKIVSGCFCVTQLNCKSRVIEIATFDGGVTGLGVDKRVIHVWKKVNKQWVTDNFIVNYGDIGKITNGVGKIIGIIGRQITAKSFKKVKDVNSLDCSYRSAGEYERVTFEEIVSTMGFKGKIYSMNQGQIFSVIEKLYLKDMKPVFQQIWKHSYYQGFSIKSRNMASAPFMLEKTVEKVLIRILFGVFKQLKKCPERKLSTVMTLTNKFVSISVEKYWNIWSSLSNGYKNAKTKFDLKLKSAGGKALHRSISRIYKASLQLYFKELKTNDLIRLKKKQKGFIKFVIICEKLVQKFRLHKFHCFFYKGKAHGISSAMSKESLSIDSYSHIEILPTVSAKGKTQPPSLSQSLLTENERSVLSKSLTKSSANEYHIDNFSASVNLVNGVSPYTDPSSPKSQCSPDIKSPESILTTQLQKRVPQKSHNPKIKFPQSIERKNSKNSGAVSARKPVIDMKSVFTVKDSLSPPMLSKFTPKGKPLRKPGSQKSQEIHSLAFLQRPNAIFDLLTKCSNRVKKETIKQILAQKTEHAVNISKLPPKPAQVSWKQKMYSLAFNKFFKVLLKVIKKHQETGFVGIKVLINS